MIGSSLPDTCIKKKTTLATHIVTAPNDHMWSYSPKKCLSKFGDNYLIFKSTVKDVNMFPQLKHIPEFYKDVILS